MVGLGFLLMLASRVALLDPVENLTLTVSSPIQDRMRDIARPIADVVNNWTDINGLRDENRQLRADNERLQSEVARLRENEVRIQQLEQLLDVKSALRDQQFQAASVVAADSNSLRQVVAIDRGRGDGIREGMVVVTQGNALVGRVTRVLDGYSWVTLITDPDAAVSAMVQESRAQGVVAGSPSGRLDMEFVGQEAGVKDGDVVITSGIGQTYPQGIVVGRVANVDKQEQELFQSVQVEPLASLNQLENVLVITSFLPQSLDQP